jgi:hypothetical protein
LGVFTNCDFECQIVKKSIGSSILKIFLPERPQAAIAAACGVVRIERLVSVGCDFEEEEALPRPRRAAVVDLDHSKAFSQCFLVLQGKGLE